MRYGPDFICVGAQKGGTSWLHWNLLWHPQVALPPEKEVNFFCPPVPNRYIRRLLARWLKNQGEWYNRYVRWRAAKDAGKIDFQLDWYERYLFSRRTAEEYRYLFPKRDGKVTGDISPSYWDIEESRVEELAKVAPDTKIIYLLRNPVDRAWSQFRMEIIGSGGEKYCSESEILARVRRDQEDFCAHSRYVMKLDMWERHFPTKTKVWFFDYLCQNPEAMFAEVCEFLQIDVNTTFDHNRIKEKVFEGPVRPMPGSVRNYLGTALKDEVIALHRRFENLYTLAWLEELQS